MKSKPSCEEFRADAVLAIEMYDSDVLTEISEKERKKKDKDGKEYVETYFENKMDLSIKMGWRLYDPTNKIIIDEFTTKDEDGATADGITKETARKNLPDVYQMGRDISYVAGRLYGERIAPTWIFVNRDYYTSVKGSEQSAMERAARMAETKDWRSAAKVWNEVIASSVDTETQGKAAYNMAIANECLGKLQNAKEWAQKAYVAYGNKKAKNYIQTIETRIYEQQLVEEQLKGSY